MATDSHLPDVDAADAEHDDPADDAETAWRIRAYVARIESYDDAPDECTVYPLYADEDERLTTWVSAKEESFVELETMR